MADFERPANMATVSADDANMVTPSDTTDLTVTPYALFIGGGGTLACVTRAGNSRTLTVSAGLLPLRVRRILATGTTATSIMALW